MIAIVCGGRDYTNDARLRAVLDAAVERLGLNMIIEGAARGADSMAKEWALARGDVSVIDVPADWSKGKSAGASRNHMMSVMLMRSDDEKACIAFPGGNGTKHMVGLCERDGVRVIKIDW